MSRDVARLGIQVAGTAYLGPIIGPSWAWAASSIVANILLPQQLPDVQKSGPRIDDLTVQSSSYGRMIPIVYGTVRLAGNVIWSTSLNEIATTTDESTGGKGGPSQSVTSTEYSYTVSFSVALCEGEIAGITRIWMNGELIWDIRSTSSAATYIATTDRWSSVTVYTGSESQAVDPTIEATQGVGNTPAYLGTAHVVFENLDVTQWRTIPQIEFEVAKTGTTAPLNTLHAIDEPTAREIYAWHDSQRNVVWASHGTAGGGGRPRLLRLDLSTEVLTELDYGANGFTGTGAHSCLDLSNGLIWLPSRDSGANDYTFAVDLDTMTVAYSWPVGATLPTSVLGVNHEVMCCRYSGTIQLRYWGVAGLGNLVYDSGLPQGGDKTAERNPDSSDPNEYWWISGNATIARLRTSSVASWTIPSSRICGDRLAISWARGKAYFLATNGGIWYLMSMTLADGTFATITSSATVFQYANDARFAEDLDRIIFQWWEEVSDTGGYLVVDPDTGAVQYDYSVSTPGPAAFSAKQFVYVDGEVCFSKAPLALQEFRFRSFTAGTEYLDDVVTDIADHVGVSAGQLTVTALSSDVVRGYAIASISTGRQAIEPLMFAYAFDTVESDQKVKAVKRGGASAAALSSDDLGAVRAGAQTGASIAGVRAQELEMPYEVRVQYLDQTADYQPGVQYDRRLASNATDSVEISMPLVFTSDEAKQIATRALYSTWANRVVVEFSTGVEFEHCEPTDVFTITNGSIVYTVRADSKANDGAVIKWKGVTEDANVYTQTVSGVSLPSPVSAVSGLVATTVALLDIALLRAQDDDVGIYVVAQGSTSGWRGAEIWRSRDDITYERTGVSVRNAGAIGVCTTALPDYLGGATTDTLSQVTVIFPAGTPAIASISETDFRLGKRGALIGDEIVLVRDAMLVSGTTYTFSYFRRGRAGTEGETSTHASGERFALLEPDSTARIALSVADVGATVYLKPVSFGRTIAQTQASAVTFANIGKRPIAPIRIKGNNDNAAGDWIIEWTRRSRLAQGWNANVDTPIGEASTKFDVEIWDSVFGTLKRTISANATETYTYTTADQVTDWGSNRSTIYVRVYQYSDSYGRGDYIQGTLT